MILQKAGEVKKRTSPNLTNVLIGQMQGIAKNGITPNSQTIHTGGAINLRSTADVEMNHSHSVPSTVGSNLGKGFYSLRNGAGNAGDSTSSANLRHRHSATFTPSITFNNSETRPINYTIQIWKRTA